MRPVVRSSYSSELKQCQCITAQGHLFFHQLHAPALLPAAARTPLSFAHPSEIDVVLGSHHSVAMCMGVAGELL